MNKAFLFDMDGVIIHSEPSWEEVENEYLTVLFGKEVAEKMGSLVGIGDFALRVDGYQGIEAGLDQAAGIERCNT